VDCHRVDDRLFLKNIYGGWTPPSPLYCLGQFCSHTQFSDLEAQCLRLWSIHPQYLDAIGLVAVWREALLAQKVLKGETRGYTHHPQLKRFKSHPNPLGVIALYLTEIWNEAERRGYHFDKGKIGKILSHQTMSVTSGQVHYEFEWLCEKLREREPHISQTLLSIKIIECHPLFTIIEGEIEAWEKIRRTPPKN
jgi:hypothetical protein